MAVARWTLRDQRAGVLGLSATTAALALLMTVIYPSYRDSLANIEIPTFFEAFLGEAGSFARPEGFVTAEVFSWLPIVVAVFALVWGTGTLAGDEESGALDLLLAEPIARRAALAGKALGLAAAVALITLAIFPGLLVGARITDMGISPGRLLSACIAQVPLAWVYLAVGLQAGAGLATRRAAAVVTSAALVGAYTVQIVAGVVPALAELDRITPLHWANASVELLQAPQPLRWLGLTGTAVLLTAGAGMLFERREIGARRTVRPHRRRRGEESPPN